MRIGQSRRTTMLRLSPLTMLLSLALLVGIGSGPAHAELTAGELLQACEQIEAHGRIDGPTANIPDTATAGLCLGFFSAVLGVTLYANTDDSRVLGICTPENLNAYELARVTARFVQRNPEHGQDRAILVVLSAAKQAYPCQKT